MRGHFGTLLKIISCMPSELRNLATDECLFSLKGHRTYITSATRPLTTSQQKHWVAFKAARTVVVELTRIQDEVM